MNPSPDRGKECLPPKKRESRQGSSEQHHAPLDDFKPPVPYRSRPSTGRGEGGREAGDRERVLTNPTPHLLHTPPPLPAPAPGLPVPLPWHLSYSPSVSLPLFSGQVSERRGSGSPAWRDDALSSPLAHHSRWLRGDGPLSLPPSPSSSSNSSFKTPFPASASSREMWSYINSGRRDYSSSLFPPSYLFSHPSLYPQDPNLAERHRYLSKRPNGLDGTGSRTASASRPLLTGEYGNDSNRVRLDVSPHSSHANGGRRQQEDLTSRVHSGPFLSDSQAQEGPEPHSSLQDRHLHGIVKTSSNLLSTSPHPLVSDSRAVRGGLMDHLGATPAEAQIYYSLGSVCHPSPQAQTYPLYSPSGTPLYNLHREPGPRQHSLRNSPHSPLVLPNSHDRSQRDRDRDQERALQRDRERIKDKEKQQQQHDKDQERDSERERRRDRDRERDRGRELSPSHLHASSPTLQPSPPALLPHFTKGSLIELASGQLKRVEELRTEDFLRSADTSPEFHLSTCTVLQISLSSTDGFCHLQVHLTDRNTQELLKVLVEYPFFVRPSVCCRPRELPRHGRPAGHPHTSASHPAAQHDAIPPPHTRPHHTHLHPSASTQPLLQAPLQSSHRRIPPRPPPPPLPLPHHPPATTPAPPRVPAAVPPAQEQQRPRKRRWSAPDTLPSTGTDESLLDLPHGSKLMKWQ
ncbi:ataxin-1-like [Mugil cephalus]|uniref:ataxin-1-like n=1 Tax=Mugil cephalus TaxID=48193 RepID=UPI001FB67FBB|nr:ataxin-1-like [Mugil cephalus]